MERDRLHAIKLADWIERNHPEHAAQAKKLKQCAAHADFLVCSDGQYRLLATCYCNLFRLCALCARRRAFRRAWRYATRLRELAFTDPSALFCFVTLTFGRTEQLGAKVRLILSDLGRLHANGQKARRVRGRVSGLQAALVSGAVDFLELGHDPLTLAMGRAPIYNPHTHGIWMCDAVPDVELLSTELAKITRASWVAHVEQLQASRESLGPEAVFQDALRALLYAQKLPQGQCRPLWHANRQLTQTGRAPRMVRSYGRLRGVSPKYTQLPMWSQPEHEWFFLSLDWDGTKYVEHGFF